MTSARSAGPRKSVLFETFKTDDVSAVVVIADRRVGEHHRRRQEAAFGADLDHRGPAVAGSGTPPSRPSVGQVSREARGPGPPEPC